MEEITLISDRIPGRSVYQTIAQPRAKMAKVALQRSGLLDIFQNVDSDVKK
jgi:hypothetical protein